jgi:hypothetical protein
MPPRKGIIRVKNPARTSRMLRKIDQLTVLRAKSDTVVALLIVRVLQKM